MSATEIYAHLKKDQPNNYQPTHPDGYYYMFTGGYGYVNGQITAEPVGDDDGPAGEIALSEESSSWKIKLKDDTGEKFKIVQWNLGEAGIPGATFDPPPDQDFDGTDKLTITASNIPTGHHNSYDGYTITVENKDGTRVKLDPRLYDIR
ncbi:hypothetical protein G4Y73_08965 [Wenzhouxiangella sp. XN201]|uniref:hypothetical protein n=1 Tax=Wenzhouxiangella sp. XN201 TaxID=2710755 RepID=UPI0013C71C2E|nr:hypothetical protein [Wenzhouxiangella sp. XN201]NEZ04273.1 hypothetical protein [Wenzhouxiangella sp. XN201]